MYCFLIMNNVLKTKNILEEDVCQLKLVKAYNL